MGQEAGEPGLLLEVFAVWGCDAVRSTADGEEDDG
jgi:hypothetical protein